MVLGRKGWALWCRLWLAYGRVYGVGAYMNEGWWSIRSYMNEEWAYRVWENFWARSFPAVAE